MFEAPSSNGLKENEHSFVGG